jgi:hypothetical protein
MKIWKRKYYENLFAKKPANETVEQYQQDIRKAQAKIEELQAKCKHESYNVMFYSWRPGAMQPSHICTTCSKYLGSATEAESKDLWDSSGFGKNTITTGTISFIDLTPTTVKK